MIQLKIMKNRLVFMTKESLILKNNHLEINSYLITIRLNKILNNRSILKLNVSPSQ